MILSALRTVDIRCAILIQVRPFCAFSNASSTSYEQLTSAYGSTLVIITFSLSVSRAEVASSNSSILGSLTRARAIATRCFCPPDN